MPNFGITSISQRTRSILYYLLLWWFFSSNLLSEWRPYRKNTSHSHSHVWSMTCMFCMYIFICSCHVPYHQTYVENFRAVVAVIQLLTFIKYYYKKTYTCICIENHIMQQKISTFSIYIDRKVCREGIR